MRASGGAFPDFLRRSGYHRGVIPQETPKGSMDVMLLAKGGVERFLRIDAQGGWEASEDTSVEAASRSGSG